MALVSTQVVIRGTKSHSIGPMKCEYHTFTVASADVSGSITAQSLASVDFAVISGISLTSAPTYSGKVVTLAFVDPAASLAGSAILYGR